MHLRCSVFEGSCSAHRVLVLFCAAVGPCASLRTIPRREGPSGHPCDTASSSSTSAASLGLLDPWTYSPEGGYFPLDHPGIYPDDICKALEDEERRQGGTPEWSRWSFKPPGSEDWLRFDPRTLCKVLVDGAHEPGHARMLFVGDSLSHHQMLSLMVEMGGYVHGFKLPGHPPRKDDVAPTRVYDMQKNDGAFLCGGQLWVQQQGSPDLLGDYHHHFNFDQHVSWLQSFDVVVLQLPWQTGIKMSPGVDFWKSIALPHQRLLFRTSTIGHEHAGVTYNHTKDAELHPLLEKRSHSEPLRSPQEVVQYFGGQEGHWSWYKHRAFAEHAMSQLEGEGFAVADYYYLSAMMWYKHRDPLHYCLPGPMDRWNDVLFNYIVRGHLRDFQEWTWRFSKAVADLGGLRNINGTSYNKERGC